MMLLNLLFWVKLLEKSVADGDNSIFKNATNVVPLKYLSNFWRLLEMSLIKCKIELKLKWTKQCVLAPVGVDNDDATSNNIIFTTKNTKLYVPVVNLSAKDNQKLSTLFSKGFERSVYRNIYETKSENKNMKNESRYFLKSNFVIRVNSLFVLV